MSNPNGDGITGSDSPGIQKTWPEHYSKNDIAAIEVINRWLEDGPKFSEEGRRTKADLARACGIKDSTFSQLLSGKYRAAPTKFLAAVLDYLERETHRDISAVIIPLVETSVYRTVSLVCERAHQNRDFGIISGEKGVGKTFTLKRYVQLTPSAVLIEGTPNMTARVFLSELIQLLGISVPVRNIASTGTKDEKMQAVVNYFKSRDALLILDEADKVNDDTLEHARRISDLASVGCVLSGTERLRSMVEASDGRHGQISSRVGCWFPVMKSITEDDAIAIVKAAFKQNNIAVRKSVCNAFWQMCDGRARVLVKLIRNVIEFGLRKGHTLNDELVFETGRQVMGLTPPPKRSKSRPTTQEVPAHV